MLHCSTVGVSVSGLTRTWSWLLTCYLVEPCTHPMQLLASARNSHPRVVHGSE